LEILGLGEGESRLNYARSQLERFSQKSAKEFQFQNFLCSSSSACSPEIISDFPPVPEHNDAARREPEKVFYVVLSLRREEKYTDMGGDR
jgi:hypothetical protein